MASLMLFGGLFLLIILQVPVGAAIGASSLAAVLVNGRLSASYVAQALVTGTDSFPIMAVPLFVLAGELMAEGGVSRRLLNVFNEMFGRITGGLAIVTVVVCMFFAAVSGSGPATVAAVGSMVYPTLIEKGYSKKFSLALIASAGAIGVIIPPSIPMVMYGVSTGTSITSLFMGGFLPGLLIGHALIFWCYFYCKRNGWKGEQSRFSLKRTLKMAWDAKWALINPIIILGGIYGGIFTPTEAASVAAIYALVVGIFVHRELNMKSLLRCLGNSCLTTATIMIILGCASAFTKVLTIEQIPAIVTHAMLTLTSSKFKQVCDAPAHNHTLAYCWVRHGYYAGNFGPCPNSFTCSRVLWCKSGTFRYSYGCKPCNRLYNPASGREHVCGCQSRQREGGHRNKGHCPLYYCDDSLSAADNLYSHHINAPAKPDRLSFMYFPRLHPRSRGSIRILTSKGGRTYDNRCRCACNPNQR